MEYSKEFKIYSKEGTKTLAKRIASHLQLGDVIALYGELGTGKTFFTQQLCSFLGVRENVSSPSYVLMNEYTGRFPICHLDLYRLYSYEEVLELGLHDIFEQNLTIIEWAEKAELFLPGKVIHIWFEFADPYRIVKIQSYKKLDIGESLSE